MKVAFLGLAVNVFKQNVQFLVADLFLRVQPGDEIKVLYDPPGSNTTEKSLTGKKLEIDWEQWNVVRL